LTGQHEVLGTVLDITTMKESEMKLQSYNKELKRSNEDLEQFAYVASHDMQEPLRKIRAFGDRLEVKYKDHLDLQGTDYIRRMQLAASRMQSMIEDLLMFSRISLEVKKLEYLEPEILIEEVKDELEILLRQKNAKIIVAGLPSFVGVRGQVKRLFQNLIVNAIKFHKENEPPIVEISGEELHTMTIREELGIVLPGNECVRLRIKDNGIGFDEKYSERIFTIFQRLHTRSAYEGTGIGLAICRKLVANHDGFITAHSKIGVGSEFVIILPKS
jgi:light-regulated signal transduction histidine kinase (bacteriophytochrome)